MANTATIRAKIDPDIKKSADSILSNLGILPSDALRMFYHQIALRKNFPIELRFPNAETVAAIEDVENGKNLEKFDSVEDFSKAMHAWK